MARQAIRHEGDKAETVFLSLVGPSRKSTNSKRGDAEVHVDGEWHFVEIKECHSNTINQVRAIKYIPLVIYSPQNAYPWLVVPPQQVVLLVSTKSRGQHNEIPFECANLSLNSMPQVFWCRDDELGRRVVDAIQEGNTFDELHTAMRELEGELKALSANTKDKIRTLQRQMEQKHRQ